jgi:hypothetical protein
MTPTAHRFYDLNGVGLAVEGPDERHAGFLDPILAPLATVDRRPDWTVTLLPADAIARPSRAAAPVWDGPLPEGLPSVLFADNGQRTLTVPDHFAMTSCHAAGHLQIHLVPAGLDSIRGTASFWLIGEILAARSRHLLHGACLVEPRTEQAVALFAPSGTGKTTTALALARNGLGLAGDDALVLEHAEDGPYLWGIPRAIKVHRRTADLLPWLQPVLKDWREDEQALRLGGLQQVVTLASPTRRRCAAVVVLQRPNPDGHRAEMISKPDAIMHIVTDNIRRAPTGVDANGQASFSAVARLVAQTPTVALSVGPDPGSLDPELIFAAIRSSGGD